MKYEALYAAVLGAVPTVLIGYVLEVRYFMSKMRPGSSVSTKGLFIPSTIVLTFFSGLLSVVALGYGKSSEVLGALVASTFLVGLVGLTAILLGGVVSAIKPKARPTR